MAIYVIEADSVGTYYQYVGGDSVNDTVVVNVSEGFSGSITVDSLPSDGGIETVDFNIPDGWKIHLVSQTVIDGETPAMTDNSYLMKNAAGVEVGTLTIRANIVKAKVVCFASGTLIKTIDGEIPVEELSVGTRVLTYDSGYQPVRWIGSKIFSSRQLSEHENLQPVRIRAGALANNMPEADLMVSQQHRILVSSKISQRMFDCNDGVLIAAKHLTMVDGIDIVETDSVAYYHFMFDKHEIIFSNGAQTESMFAGPEALKAVSPEAREEILTLFPEVASIDYEATSCRPFVNGRLGRKLAARHQKNGKELNSNY